MANAFFAGSSGASWDLLVEAAYNREADFALRDAPVWMQTVDTKANRQAMPGDTVTFTIHKDLAALATTPLTETVDPDAVAPQAPDRVVVTLNEYGNATLETIKLDTLSFTQPEKEKAVIVGRNMVDTIDSLIQAVADSSTNTLALAGGALSTSAVPSAVTSTDTMQRKIAAAAVTYLRGDKVIPQSGDDYLAICHPYVLHDLMAENSATAWIGPHVYGTDTNAVYNGEVGKYMGARYLSTTRTTIATDGPTSQKVYRSYYFGKQALAEAVAIDPHLVVGPQVDKLRRFNPLGWYALLGYGLYRPKSLRKVYTQTTVS
jgi:N4-gp56 family major capsid protein